MNTELPLKGKSRTESQTLVFTTIEEP